MNRKFNSYEEFYRFYLREHSKAKTRIFHCVGSLMGLVFLGIALWRQEWSLIFWGFLIGYGVAWTSHFFIERNKPATIKYPLYSFLADFRMLLECLTGKLSLKEDLPRT